MSSSALRWQVEDPPPARDEPAWEWVVDWPIQELEVWPGDRLVILSDDEALHVVHWRGEGEEPRVTRYGWYTVADVWPRFGEYIRPSFGLV